MERRTDAGNIGVYSRWAPVHDAVLGGLFAGSRRRALDLLDLHRGDRVVLPGVGTGLDLPLLPLPDHHVDLVEGDAVAFLRAAVSSLRVGGRAVVFDKFAPPGRVSLVRRAVNVVSSRLGT